MRRSRLFGIGLMAGLAFATSASAIVVTPNTTAMDLAGAVTAGGGSGLTATGATLASHTDGVVTSSGTFTNASGTYGIGPGIILSSGGVENYGDGPNTSGGFTTDFGVAATAAQNALLTPISGITSHFDVTQLDVVFDVDAVTDTVFFNVVWGSDEFAEWIGSSFIDAFGLYLNGTNLAFVDGDPVNVDHPSMGAFPGTELDGVLGGSTGAFGPLVHTFSGAVTPGSTGNVLTFIIADSGDDALDSTVYISQLGGTPPPPPDPNAVPEPATATMGLVCLVAGALYGRRRRLA